MDTIWYNWPDQNKTANLGNPEHEENILSEGALRRGKEPCPNNHDSMPFAYPYLF